MSKPTLALIPSGQKATKVYSILPNDGSGDFTFARTGEATRVRKDGLIEAVATTVPRLDWLNSDCSNLLLEPQRTNIQIRSEEFDNAAWTKQADLTVTANQVTSPTGELTADKIQRGSTVDANNYLVDAASKSSSAQLDACTSVFVKQGEGDFFAFRMSGTYPNRADAIFQFSNTTLTTSVAGADFTITSSKVENYGNGWYRLSVVYNTDAAATITSAFSPRGTSGQIDATDTSTSAFVYLWGCQVEEGASLTSYIETPADAAVTRNKDVCTGAGDASTFNNSEGVFYVNLSALQDVSPTNRYISLSDGSVSNSILMLFNTGGNLLLYNGGTGGTNLIYSDSSIDLTQNIKIAIQYGNSTSDYKVFIDGVSKSVSGSFSATQITALNEIKFEYALNFNLNFFGKVKGLSYYDTALTDAELKKLTT